MCNDLEFVISRVSFDIGIGYSKGHRWANNGRDVLQIFQSIRADAYCQNEREKKKSKRNITLESFCAGQPLQPHLLTLL